MEAPCALTCPGEGLEEATDRQRRDLKDRRASVDGENAEGHCLSQVRCVKAQHFRADTTSRLFRD